MNTSSHANNSGITMNYIEAYKALIEFVKVIISISSTLLAALISYIVVQDLTISWWLIISPMLLIASIGTGLLSFGRAIIGVRDNASQKNVSMFGNASAAFLVCGILALGFIKINQQPSPDEMMESIQHHTTSFHARLLPDSCESIEKKGDNYIFQYKVDSNQYIVTYSTSEKKIISLTPRRGK